MTGIADLPQYPVNDLTSDDPDVLREVADSIFRAFISVDEELHEANQRIAAVAALHVPSPVRGLVCAHCLFEWPCATAARALGVES